ncbi:MAG TPA: TasA family protein [Candidatus Paceibacterota bacterium]|nr:TasA family protein [Candidatus Paceibacterota bacterium]
MKKILMSLGVIVAVGAIVAGATGAFFSDSETSVGNTFTAGAIDLGIDNESYYNGVLNDGTTWDLSFDLDECEIRNPEYNSDTDQDGDGIDADGDPEFFPCLFFNFDDLKPGDYGEDTISVHITNNEAWLCADVTLTKNDDMSCTEPENDVDAENGACVDPGPGLGDLAQEIDFLWWADDGDNVLEDDETPLPAGKLGSLGVGNTATVPLADSNGNIWTGNPDDPILTDEEDEILYIGKAWCFGDITPAPVPQDGFGDQMTPAGDNEGAGNVGNGTLGQPSDGGYACDGEGVGNEPQTDQAMLNVSFRAVQARHNDDFQCVPQQQEEPAQLTVIKEVIPSTAFDQDLGVGDFDLFVDATAVVSGVANVFGTGAHVVSETAVAGYSSAISGDCDAAGNVTLNPGDNKTCTITNTEVADASTL